MALRRASSRARKKLNPVRLKKMDSYNDGIDGKCYGDVIGNNTTSAGDCSASPNVGHLNPTEPRIIPTANPARGPGAPREHKWGPGPRGRRTLITAYIRNTDVTFQRKYCAWESCFGCKRTGIFEINCGIGCKLYCCAECRELLVTSPARGIHHSFG